MSKGFVHILICSFAVISKKYNLTMSAPSSHCLHGQQCYESAHQDETSGPRRRRRTDSLRPALSCGHGEEGEQGPCHVDVVCVCVCVCVYVCVWLGGGVEVCTSPCLQAAWKCLCVLESVHSHMDKGVGEYYV